MNEAKVARAGLVAGAALFLLMLALPAPQGMTPAAWTVAALVVLMAVWWMTEALPLTVTALLPFVVVPFTGAMTSAEVAGAYWSPILFLVLGGAFIALAIERTGLHRRVALAVLGRAGKSSGGLLFAFMAATALVSMVVSNTSTTLIMMPIALAVLVAGGLADGDTEGLSGALPMGVAFAANIGGLGTLVGSPTNAIAVGLIERQTGWSVDFVGWAMFGLPLVAIALPLAWLILMRVQRVATDAFDGQAARNAIGAPGPWSSAERRLAPLIVLIVAAWVLLPLLSDRLPKGMVEDGTVAILGSLLLFIVPDGTGRPLLNWKEADRAPWGVILMFGGGLALASGISASGLDDWLGSVLRGLAGVHPLIVALALCGLVILITEFASNVATASGAVPIVAALIVATGVDPAVLAMTVAMAASWGFMLPAGTGPNAIAWSTGRIALPRVLTAGFVLDVVGVFLIVGVVATVAALA